MIIILFYFSWWLIGFMGIIIFIKLYFKRILVKDIAFAVTVGGLGGPVSLLGIVIWIIVFSGKLAGLLNKKVF